MSIARELFIRPTAPQAELAIITVLNVLDQGDEFELHTEVNPPWMRVVSHRPDEIVTAMEETGVSVQLGSG
jgi:hypothetical protein